MTTLHLNEITARQNRAMLSRLVYGLQENIKRRAAQRALLKLDDRMLKDIGVSRASVIAGQF
jgi:uncharacterized protein YjiS (DUF1127 family)